ncbi:DinB family protein [Dyella sp. 20L07]|uniref:DinB family protein n=1 Tax=Dyella sp. 20L07 TaxID=3384240 RepID=UPI003D29316C
MTTNRCDYVRKMAAYNTWMNDKVYAAAANLPAHEIVADRKAFFGSILATLNHLAVADTIWLQRFAAHPAHYAMLSAFGELPKRTNLAEQLYGDLADLREHRRFLDGVIERWADAVSEGDLDQVLAYANTKGVASRRPFFYVLMHFFNHQTHHRGQVTTLLTQAGVDVGTTDLLMLIEEV